MIKKIYSIIVKREMIGIQTDALINKCFKELDAKEIINVKTNRVDMYPYSARKVYEVVIKFEVKEKPVDWSKVPIDTNVLCRVNGCVYKRHYAGLHCGHPSVWEFGLTSYSTFDKRIAYEWDSVELADATE